jgi:hypothetical protein
MPRKTRHLTSKLQFSPNFTLDSVADSNYRGKCDVGVFLIFEWTLLLNIMGRITTPLLKLPITKIVIKINIKRYRFMQL